MTDKSDPAQVRRERLGAALRENLKRRKAQARGRAANGVSPPAPETGRPERDAGGSPGPRRDDS